jgi:hypothetical protein
MRRVNLWGFDDVLAASSQAVASLRLAYPDVPEADWWTDPSVSTQAAKVTEPIVAAWDVLAATPGDHIIATGRVLPAVLLWLSRRATSADIRPALARVTNVESTESGDWPTAHAAGRRALVVSRYVQPGVELHFYEANPVTLQTVTSFCPSVHAHQLLDGALVPKTGYTWNPGSGAFPPT